MQSTLKPKRARPDVERVGNHPLGTLHLNASIPKLPERWEKVGMEPGDESQEHEPPVHCSRQRKE